MSLIHPGTPRRTFSLALLTLVACSSGWTAPVTQPQARAAASGWFKVSPTAMARTLARQITNMETQTDQDGRVLFYVAHLAPKGFIVLSPDDLLEPVVAFSPTGRFEATKENPLFDFLAGDMRDRLEGLPKAVPGTEALNEAHGRNQSKWERFLYGADNAERYASERIASVDDPRVDPVVLSKWNQQTAGGGNCYNYYTPNGYPCGCVATAMAQIMRFFQHPATGIGVHAFDIEVDGAAQSASTRGGDGSGGAYDWSQMPLVPPASTPAVQRAMIGALCYDAGLSVNMSYASSGSGTDTLVAADAFKNTFHYANAVKGFNSGNELSGATFNAMVNTNLDAGQPVQLGITGASGGHSIVCDGYGYNTSTLYHHLNMGWSGSSDAWYNLPNINSSPSFNKVYKVIYNIWPSGSGEVLSGRVVDSSSNPIQGATVTAGSYTATTSARGIYAIPHIPAGTYTIQAAKSGYTFTAQSKTVGTSADNTMTTGNLWGVNFTGTSGCTAPTINTQPASQTIASGQSATLTVSATNAASYQWYVGTSGTTTNPIGGATSATYTTPAVTTTTSYWVRVTNTCGSTNSATTTITVGQPNLIVNGGFESGTSPWTGTTAVIGSWPTQPPYAGTRCAFMLGKGKTTTQSLYQTVTIPSTAASATLNLYLHIDTAETTTSTAYDKLVVSLKNSTGGNVATLATYSNLNKSAGYALRSYDVSAYKGQTLRIHFNATEDYSLQTSFVIDNVSLDCQ